MIRDTDAVPLTLPVGERDHIRGTCDAAVTLVEYGDYECANSGQANTAIKAIQARLGTRLRFVFRHSPLNQLHARAQRAAESAEAAGAQDQFWEMHETLFAHQEALDNGFLVEYAHGLGLDTIQFLRDMAQHTHTARVQEDSLSGMDSGVCRTPAFFINGIRFNPPWDEASLLAAVEQAAVSPGNDVAPHAP